MVVIFVSSLEIELMELDDVGLVREHGVQDLAVGYAVGEGFDFGVVGVD